MPLKTLTQMDCISRNFIVMALCIAGASYSHGQPNQAAQTATQAPAKAASSDYTVLDADGFPQPARRAFEPGPDGTPLPPKNPDAAKYWPPEFKRFLDSALSLFKRDGKEPSLDEVSEVLNIRLIPLPQLERHDFTQREFSVGGIPFGPPEPMKWGHQLAILDIYRDRVTSWQLDIFFDPLKFCVSPYEAAVYLGESFSESDRRVHVSNRDFWPPSYTWGMFKRGSQGEHLGQSIWFFTPQQEFNKPHRDPGCITRFLIIRRFIKEQK